MDEDGVGRHNIAVQLSKFKLILMKRLLSNMLVSLMMAASNLFLLVSTVRSSMIDDLVEVAGFGREWMPVGN